MRAELVAAAVVVEDGELRLGVAERHLLALPGDARGEDLVLELVVGLGELPAGEPGPRRSCAGGRGARARLVRRLLLALAQRRELRPREEIGVARDDRRLLGNLLLADGDRPALLRSLVEVLLQPFLVLGGAADDFGDIWPNVCRTQTF